MSDYETAEAIRLYMLPFTSVEPKDVPVGQDSKNWATSHVHALRLYDLAKYQEALSWFYSEKAPTDRLPALIKFAEKALPVQEVKGFREMLGKLV